MASVVKIQLFSRWYWRWFRVFCLLSQEGLLFSYKCSDNCVLNNFFFFFYKILRIYKNLIIFNYSLTSSWKESIWNRDCPRKSRTCVPYLWSPMWLTECGQEISGEPVFLGVRIETNSLSSSWRFLVEFNML